MYRLGKSSPTTPTSLTALKKLAATAAWLAEPPSSRGFSALGVLMESNAVEPTINTLMQVQPIFRVSGGRKIKGWLAARNKKKRRRTEGLKRRGRRPANVRFVTK